MKRRRGPMGRQCHVSGHKTRRHLFYRKYVLASQIIHQANYSSIDVTVSLEPTTSISLTASPYLKSKVDICYRTMPYTHEACISGPICALVSAMLLFGKLQPSPGGLKEQLYRRLASSLGNGWAKRILCPRPISFSSWIRWPSLAVMLVKALRVDIKQRWAHFDCPSADVLCIKMLRIYTEIQR
jgi:hypothetical protein